jgi:integrase
MSTPQLWVDVGVAVASQCSKLNSLKVQRINARGRYSDGGGLYLQVSIGGTKSWLFRFMLNGKKREMGLGAVDLVSLSEARSKTLDCRRLLMEGVDPIDARDSRRKLQLLESARTLTFDQCAKSYIDAHRDGWKNAKHVSQWTNTLQTYASPLIGQLPVQAIDTSLIIKVLDPIWREKTETASRLRNRIELILSWATAAGFRSGDNPARWRGHLETMLPKKSKVQRVQHHPALPISELGSFMKKLRVQTGIAAWALEFLILTATRTGEVIGAQWSEINLSEKIWIIPPSRMKAQREHRVPLSPRTIGILEAMQGIHAVEESPFVFPSSRSGKPMSNMALLAVLKRMGYEITTHGFRSTFRDWAAERTNFPREVAEAALAHTIGKVEAAYRRGDLFEKRRNLMNQWSAFCGDDSNNSISLIDLNSEPSPSQSTLERKLSAATKIASG